MDEAQELYTQQTGVTFADTQYKASGELNEMLAAGSYADLEITASKGTMDTAVEKGYVDESTRTDMFTNELVIVAKQGSNLKDVTLADIAAGKYSVCVGDDSGPRRQLRRSGPLYRGRLRASRQGRRQDRQGHLR